MTFDDVDYTRAGALALFLVASTCTVASVVSAVSTHAKPHEAAVTLAEPVSRDVGIGGLGGLEHGATRIGDQAPVDQDRADADRRRPAEDVAMNDREAPATGWPTR